VCWHALREQHTSAGAQPPLALIKVRFTILSIKIFVQGLKARRESQQPGEHLCKNAA